jgi:tRNA 2-thiouridine synthesizing protein A
MVEVNCIGLSCPIPLVRVQKAIASHPGEPLLVRVDTETAREHVTRMAEQKGYTVTASKKGGETDLALTPVKS